MENFPEINKGSQPSENFKTLINLSSVVLLNYRMKNFQEMNDTKLAAMAIG